MFENLPNDCKNMAFVPKVQNNFNRNQHEFLNYVVLLKDIYMDLMKVQIIMDWQTPSFVHNVQCFLGFFIFLSWVRPISHFLLFKSNQAFHYQSYCLVIDM